MTIRIATIGTSSIVHRFAAAASEVADIELVTAYSRDAGRAAETAEALGMASSTADWDGLLADAEIDAVYIASPNLAHAEQAKDAIRAGKHVLIEKSATPTAAEWEELVALAAEHDVVIVEEMRPANDPGTFEIARLMGDLGPIRRVRFDYTQRSARYDKVLAGEKVNVFDPALAGGTLYDLGVYAVSQLVQLFGEPNDVLAADVKIITGADGLGVFLGLYDGFIADVSYSKITRTALPSEIQGERGSLAIDHLDDPRVLEVTDVDGNVNRVEIEKTADNMTYQIQFFADVVLGRKDAAADHARTLGTLRVMDKVREVRRWV